MLLLYASGVCLLCLSCLRHGLRITFRIDVCSCAGHQRIGNEFVLQRVEECACGVCDDRG